MRFEAVNQTPAFRTSCYDCAKPMQSDKDLIWADLDGEAFTAYYCRACYLKADKAKKENWRCPECHAEMADEIMTILNHNCKERRPWTDLPRPRSQS